MKKRITKTLIMVSKYTLIGVFMQLFLANMLVAHESNAQKYRSVKEIEISIDLRNATLEEAFTQIESITSLKFNYHKSDLNSNSRINYNAKKVSTEAVLLYISKEAGLKFKQVNENVNVSKITSNNKKEKAVEIIIQAMDVTGKITSMEDKEGLPGVNVIEKGTSNGTVTDVNGNYRLTVAENAVLVFSSVGFVSEEVNVNGRSIVDLQLVPDIRQLEELVVVGYGSIRKSDVTGALTSVSAETIQERPVQNVLNALQGKAAGMHVSSNIRPGELPSVTIRGNRSINASNVPLYVVDGVPLITAPDSRNTPANMNDINPNDISSIEILKDASATAIYGSRGANGVILITTKKGAKGSKATVNYSSTVTLDSYKSLTDLMTGGEYFDRWRLALINGRQYQPTTNKDLTVPADMWYPDPALDRAIPGLNSDARALESLLMGYEWEDGVIGGTVLMRPTTAAEREMGWPDEIPIYNSKNVRNYDWTKDATRQGITQDHQISLSAGSESSRVYVSFGYFDQIGVQRDQDYKRYNALLNGDISPNNWLTVGASLNTSFSHQNFGISTNNSNTGAKDLYSRAVNQLPFTEPKDENGEYIRFPQLNVGLWNPLIDIDQSINERRATSILGSMFADVKFTPWLKYRLNFGSQYRDFRRGSWTGPLTTGHLTARPNTAGYNDEETFSWLIENLLFLDKKFGNAHNLGLTLLQSAQQFRRESINVGAQSTINEYGLWYDLGANILGRATSYGSGFSENSMMSYMARANYSLMDKYLLTASARFDGASVLAPGNKWDFFPSFALAWKLHEEDFLNGVGWINEIKPRFGYGIVGNSSIGPYLSGGPLSRNMYVFGSSAAAGYLPQLVKNPNLSWEKTAQINFGLDFSMMKSRLSGSIEVYEAKTRDLMFRRTLIGPSGYVEKMENIGKTRNKGVEVTLSAIAVEAKDFSWDVNLNWASNSEEILELINGKEDMLAERLFIGHPTQVYYHLDNAGIWQNTPEDLEEMAKYKANGINFFPGTIKVVDQLTVDTNGDGIPDEKDYRINAEDYVIRGTNRPKWTGGITNTFRYKNLELSSFIYTRVGQTFFGGYPNLNGGNGGNGRVENDVWSWTNPNGKWPMPNTATTTNIPAAMQYHDGSFVAVKNISLTYTLPTSFLARLRMTNVQFNVQVLNPFIFGGEVVKMGINPDDVTNWDNQSLPNSFNTNPAGGMNTNSILFQSYVFGLKAGF